MRGGFPNIRHMRVFLEAANCGSVSAAAERCHLSQPAATQALSRLEADLGTALLVRKRQRFALTRCGAAFERRVASALKHLQDGARAALRDAGLNKRRAPTFDQSVTSAQLRNLIAVANSGSFTVASRALGLSQPTVHRTARSLEAIAGVPFFTARSSGVRLTPAAEAFVLGAKLAQAELRQGVEEIGRELGEDKGTFVLGSLPLARTTIVPKAIHAMVSSTEGVQVRVVDGRYSELLRSLREGDLDCLIGALRHPLPAEDVEQKLLFRDALAIVAHPNHPLAKRRNLDLEETLAFPWIAPPKETPAGQYLFEALRIHEREASPVRAVSSAMATLRGVLSEGNYISVVSRHQISVDERLGMIAVLDIPLTGHVRDIGLTFRKDWRPTETQVQFIKFLQEFSKQSPPEGAERQS
ncbi:MAG: LysR family transcriptional regulator [Boseongicola sp. SB0676_bin_33]|uniref:LysR family transcriptional regulator n=1 Tax=Boseongicola sp. SB0664_bin_43 TaxID=2604844 RepID=A0A6B0XY46_9RHOB|nr:LysR family transcriptional regulator [Boseongicola sp. SB0664_bin_43]MYF90130.1 LysR family transcriptional regulator [Boseongicola sp. SB0676_bin_33]